MKLIKPMIFFIFSLVLYSIISLIVSRIISVDYYKIFIEYYLAFNLLFITLYIYLSDLDSRLIITLLGIFSLLIYILSAEIIYPLFLNSNIAYKVVEYEPDIISHFELEVEDREVNSSVLDRAMRLIDEGQFSTAWILADNFLLRHPDSLLAEDIKEIAELKLEGNKEIDTNPRYIESVQYNKFRSQNRLFDAYYYVDKLLKNSDSYSYDLLIKKESCYYELLTDYYSIQNMENILTKAAYTDIRFYYSNDGITEYNIERLVEFNDKIYMKNVSINDINYPYIFIDELGKVFSSGFSENSREIIQRPTPEFHIEADEFKLFSKEYYELSLNSLYSNIKIYSMSSIRYYSSDRLIKLIIQKFTSYCTLVAIFLMAWFTFKRFNFLDYLFVNILFLSMTKWFIKKIGLIISYYGLGLSLGFIAIIYTAIFIYLQRRSTPLPSRS